MPTRSKTDPAALAREEAERKAAQDAVDAYQKARNEKKQKASDERRASAGEPTKPLDARIVDDADLQRAHNELDRRGALGAARAAVDALLVFWITNLREHWPKWHSCTRGAALTIFSVTRLLDCATHGTPPGVNGIYGEISGFIQTYLKLKIFDGLAKGKTWEYGFTWGTAEKPIKVSDLGALMYKLMTVVVKFTPREQWGKLQLMALDRIACYYGRASAWGSMGTECLVHWHMSWSVANMTPCLVNVRRAKDSLYELLKEPLGNVSLIIGETLIEELIVGYETVRR